MTSKAKMKLENEFAELKANYEELQEDSQRWWKLSVRRRRELDTLKQSIKEIVEKYEKDAEQDMTVYHETASKILKELKEAKDTPNIKQVIKEEIADKVKTLEMIVRKWLPFVTVIVVSNEMFERIKELSLGDDVEIKKIHVNRKTYRRIKSLIGEDR